MIKYLLIIFSLTNFYACVGKNCSNLPVKFRSYEDAATKISKVTFAISESVNTSKSSWITSAKYKSCDGENGFLLIGAGSSEYIHQGVPISIWKGFKEAESLGSFYNRYIKRRYHLMLE